MNVPEDDRLRTQFANLRAEDQGAAPPFARTAAAAAALTRRRATSWMAVAVLPVLALAVILAVRTPRATEPPPREIAAWSSPTAFLLETPGQQFLKQTPRLGEPIPALPAVQDEPK
jgi:hypothetical protein